MTRIHLLIAGRVQGVFFRNATQTEAQRLGVVGWVRNLADGRVEVTAEGEDAAINAIVTWAHQGPTFARVDEVEITRSEPTGEFTSFEVR
jgi:acylphosphatase